MILLVFLLLIALSEKGVGFCIRPQKGAAKNGRASGSMFVYNDTLQYFWILVLLLDDRRKKVVM